MGKKADEFSLEDLEDNFNQMKDSAKSEVEEVSPVQETNDDFDVTAPLPGVDEDPPEATSESSPAPPDKTLEEVEAPPEAEETTEKATPEAGPVTPELSAATRGGPYYSPSDNICNPSNGQYIYAMLDHKDKQLVMGLQLSHVKAFILDHGVPDEKAVAFLLQVDSGEARDRIERLRIIGATVRDSDDIVIANPKVAQKIGQKS